jgi:hypothetical protein
MNTYVENIENPIWLQQLKLNAQKAGINIYFIPEIEIDYTKSHKDAAKEGGPYTPDSYNIFELGNKYSLSSERKVIKESIILLNGTAGGDYKNFVEWGLLNGLRKTIPHVPFAIGKYYPKLYKQLGINFMCILENMIESYPETIDLLTETRDELNSPGIIKWISVVETTGCMYGNIQVACSVVWDNFTPCCSTIKEQTERCCNDYQWLAFLAPEL